MTSRDEVIQKIYALTSPPNPTGYGFWDDDEYDEFRSRWISQASFKQVDMVLNLLTDPSSRPAGWHDRWELEACIVLNEWQRRDPALFLTFASPYLQQSQVHPHLFKSGLKNT